MDIKIILKNRKELYAKESENEFENVQNLPLDGLIALMMFM